MLRSVDVGDGILESGVCVGSCAVVPAGAEEAGVGSFAAVGWSIVPSEVVLRSSSSVTAWEEVEEDEGLERKSARTSGESGCTLRSTSAKEVIRVRKSGSVGWVSEKRTLSYWERKAMVEWEEGEGIRESEARWER